jgi:hypothetical protein
MRNFGSMKIELAEADARAARLGLAFAGIDHAVSARGDGPVFRNICGVSFSVRSSGLATAANDNLVYFAGLVLTGYSDTSGAPLANLRR